MNLILDFETFKKFYQNGTKLYFWNIVWMLAWMNSMKSKKATRSWIGCTMQFSHSIGRDRTPKVQALFFHFSFCRMSAKTRCQRFWFVRRTSGFSSGLLNYLKLRCQWNQYWKPKPKCFISFVSLIQIIHLSFQKSQTNSYGVILV